MASTTNLSNDSPKASGPQSSLKLASPTEPSIAGSKTGENKLAVDFQPNDYSVLCCRGKAANHIGNRRFRIVSSMYVEKYSRADTKAAKSVIVFEIITAIRQAGGNFCKHKRGLWFEVGDKYAREKVSALLRDLLHSQYRSSNKSKTALRKARKQSLKPSVQTRVGNTRDSDDSSLSSSCWESSKDDLLLEHSPEYDFFDIYVF